MKKQYIRKPRTIKPFQYRGTYTDWGVRYFEEQRRLNYNGTNLFLNFLSLCVGLPLFIYSLVVGFGIGVLIGGAFAACGIIGICDDVKKIV